VAVEIRCSERLEGREDLDLESIARVIREAAEAVLRQEGKEGTVSVLVTDDAEIRELNRRYLNADRPTDVMAFSMLEGEEIASPEKVIGDVVISVETAERQAEEYDTTFLDEIALLTVHGVLHLLGYDDQTDEERSLMRDKEREALRNLREGG